MTAEQRATLERMKRDYEAGGLLRDGEQRVEPGVADGMVAAYLPAAEGGEWGLVIAADGTLVSRSATPLNAG